MSREPSIASAGFGACPIPRSGHREIVLGHGSGGKLSARLIGDVILPRFRNPLLDPLGDGAIFPIGGTRLAFSTDSFVVNPLFFPGGNIGDLAVNGTVNDLAMCGARPLHLSAALILEEGLPIADLDRILASMRTAADAAGVTLVTGDTKVVDRGKGDKLFITTSGIGIVRDGVDVGPGRASPGDRVLVSGPIGQHGMAIMSVREGLEFETEISSDTAPLAALVESLLDAAPATHTLRDPTRGGLASALNEIAGQSCTSIRLDESAIPITEPVKAACEILGLDPLYVACEGRLLAIVPPGQAPAALDALRSHPLASAAADIGEVLAADPGLVTLKTRIGGSRVVDTLAGEQLPRIC